MMTKRFSIRSVMRLVLLCLISPSLSAATAAGKPSLALTSFGAVGDDRADDTQALQDAFRQAGGRCLDGEGRTYRVRGSLRVDTDFCLANARLRQDVAQFDTRPWIEGDCPVEQDPELLSDCGDPAMPDHLAAALSEYLYTRTLLIRPDEGAAPIEVELRNVSVDRGASPASGARSDAAGIWIANAARLELEDVEVTGAGKGYGVMIVDSSNVTIRRLWLHDLVWAPYAGDAPLSLERVQQTGWNSAPIREFRSAGDRGAPHSGFQGMRVQEQLTCLMIQSSRNVLIDRLRIEGCRARFAEGDIPWQADGLGIGQSSSAIRVEEPNIADTWEGIDIVGGGLGVQQVAISRARISNSFGYAIKAGYDTRQVSVIDSVISRAGLAGVVFYGRVRNALVRRVRIEEPGSVNYAGALYSPWRQERAGVLVQTGGSAATADAYPTGVVLESVTVQGGRDCRFGLLNLTPERLALEDMHASGCELPNQHDPR